MAKMEDGGEEVEAAKSAGVIQSLQDGTAAETATADWHPHKGDELNVGTKQPMEPERPASVL